MRSSSGLGYTSCPATDWVGKFVGSISGIMRVATCWCGGRRANRRDNDARGLAVGERDVVSRACSAMSGSLSGVGADGLCYNEGAIDGRKTGRAGPGCRKRTGPVCGCGRVFRRWVAWGSPRNHCLRSHIRSSMTRQWDPRGWESQGI